MHFHLPMSHSIENELIEVLRFTAKQKEEKSILRGIGRRRFSSDIRLYDSLITFCHNLYVSEHAFFSVSERKISTKRD